MPDQIIPEVPPPATATSTTSTRQVDEASALRESDAAVLRTAGQRQINLIWELTQQKIAFLVIGMSLLVGGVLAIGGSWLGSGELQLAAVVFLFGVANLVTGFYFGRTNHQRVGGVGASGNDTR